MTTVICSRVYYCVTGLLLIKRFTNDIRNSVGKSKKRMRWFFHFFEGCD